MNDTIMLLAVIALSAVVAFLAHITAKGVQEILMILSIHRERLNELEEKEKK